MSYKEGPGNTCCDTCTGGACYRAHIVPSDDGDFGALDGLDANLRQRLINALLTTTANINQLFRLTRIILAPTPNLTIALVEAGDDLKLKFVRIVGEDTDVRVSDI
jgi:hypothetical protein